MKLWKFKSTYTFYDKSRQLKLRISGFQIFFYNLDQYCARMRYFRKREKVRDIPNKPPKGMMHFKLHVDFVPVTP